jgi:hypothetical protein
MHLAGTKAQMERLDKFMPKWIQDYIILGKGVTRDPVKISFLLLPDDVPGMIWCVNCLC